MEKYNFTPFQKVLVRYDDSDYWRASFYSHYNEETKLHICVGSMWKYCIPYEGNEALLGNTDNPQPKRWRAEDGGSYWFVNSDGNIYEVCDTSGYYDNMRYYIGNYFHTKEGAKKTAEKYIAMLNFEQK